MAWTKSLVAARNQHGANPELEYLITSDGSAGSVEIWHRCMKGKYLQDVITEPIDPSAGYTITVKDNNGVTMASIPERSTSNAERYDYPSNNGNNFDLTGPVTFEFGDLGDAGEQVTLKVIVAG
jgi:hypothetical protein